MKELDKIPPQDLNLEEAVLGALMLERTAYERVGDALHPETFYNPVNGLIFAAIQTLNKNSQKIDALTVRAELLRTGNLEGVGGSYYLSQLTNKVSSAAHLETHAKFLIQHWTTRRLIEISSNLNRLAFDYDADPFELITKTEMELFNLTTGVSKSDAEGLDQLTFKAIKQIEIAGQMKSGLTGVGSGFTTIDRITGGWQTPDLVILAARPGMGKTALALNFAVNAAKIHQKTVGIFSLEMSKLQLTNRVISSETGLSSEQIRTGKLYPSDWDNLNKRTREIESLKIIIDDTGGLPILALKSRARRMKSRNDVNLIIVDYLQLCTHAGNKNQLREQEINQICEGLKSLAKELEVPIIALSQLSRETEKRTDKRPILSDLRDSGSIEQTADQVIFLYRPEYYGRDELVPLNGVDYDPRGLCEFIIAKNRNGPLRTEPLMFHGPTTSFSDYEQPNQVREVIF